MSPYSVMFARSRHVGGLCRLAIAGLCAGLPVLPALSPADATAPSRGMASAGISVAIPAVARSRVAIVESRAREEESGTLLRLVVGLGADAYDLSSEIEAGSGGLGQAGILLVGSDAVADRSVTRWLDSSAAMLREFVEGGGCLVFFAQPVAERPLEDWMPPGMFLLRGGGSVGRPGYVQREHPLFAIPNAISHRRFADDWQGGPVAQHAFLAVSRGSVLAARDGVGHDPWCAEFGWGRGRAIFLACRPEAGRGAPPATRLVARDLIENVLAYARDVVRGKAASLPDAARIVRSSSSWRPKTWEDSPRAAFSFETAVNAAIDRGVTFLKGRQRADGSWPSHGRHQVGPTALAVVALLGSGINKHESYVGRAVDFLLDHPPDPYGEDSFTYDVGLTMMALDAWAAPMYERFELARLAPEKRARYTFQRQLSERERDLMVRCRDWLAAAQHQSGYWNYSSGNSARRGDLSNTQFAVLGLRAGSRCDVSVPQHVWRGVIEALLESQARSGSDVTMPRFVRPAGEKGRPRFYMIRTRARPWGYTSGSEGSRSASGSRTAMGVSSLLISYEDLTQHSRRTAGRYARGVSDAVGDGLAWLWAHFSVTENPLAGGSHEYYYLYALERVGVLGDVRFLGDRDWYREGAARLLAVQDRSGGWGRDANATCFALMFLERSTPPPVTTLQGR